MEHHGMEIPYWTKPLFVLGEAGIAQTGRNKELRDREMVMIVIRFTSNYGPDVVWMVNLEILETPTNREVI